MSLIGQRLIEAANEMVAIARGEADPSTYTVHTPEQLMAYEQTRQTLPAKIRANLGLSQKEFAKKYHITLSRLQDWEQRRSEPDSLARAYLLVIEREGEAVDRALAA